LGAPLEEGGEPVWLAGGHMPPALERKIFALKPGKLAGPLASDYGFHVVRVLKKRPPVEVGLAEAAEEIQRSLAAEKMEKLADEWIEKLRGEADIRYDPDFLAHG
jgi:peptidyl-prolyl cis-trans isomerase C